MGWAVGCLLVRTLPLTFPCSRTPVAILDADNQIIVVLAGRPSTNNWDQVHTHMSSLLQQVGDKAVPACCECRGNFTVLSFRVS